MMKKTYKTLYKTSSGGKLQSWDVSVVSNYEGSTIVVEWGQVDGAKQTKETLITEGKNIGKANETNHYSQACSEAESKWKKQQDKGYSEVATVTRKVLPMLAHRHDEHGHKIIYPAYVQPKLDGVRCLFHNGQLISRKAKVFTALPHILAAAQECGLPLDGELYVHGDAFQDIISMVKRDGLHPDHERVEYHIYDLVLPGVSYRERYERICKAAEKWKNPLIKVATHFVSSEDEMYESHGAFISEGYEGSIIRNAHGDYKPDKRSYDLQKVKEFIDEEFEIIGFESDKNNEVVFTCKTKEGNDFRVKPEGSHEQRSRYVDDGEKLIGKMLTVRFFEWSTSEKSVPRFPVGVAIRDYD